MSPANDNKEIVKGASFYEEWQAFDGTPSKSRPTDADIQADITAAVLVPRNLTGVTVLAKLSKAEDGTNPIITFASGVSDAVNGKFYISLTPANTAAMSGWTRAFYSVKLTYPSGTVEIPVEGAVVLNKVTV